MEGEIIGTTPIGKPDYEVMLKQSIDESKQIYTTTVMNEMYIELAKKHYSQKNNIQYSQYKNKQYATTLFSVSIIILIINCLFVVYYKRENQNAT